MMLAARRGFPPVVQSAVLTVVIGAAFGSSDSQAQAVPNASDPEAQLPYTLCCSVYPRSLELAHVQVYEDKRSVQAGTRYLIFPYFYPSWSKFRSEVKTQCDGRPNEHVATATLEAQFASLVVNDEVVDRLKQQGHSDASLGKLQSFPFTVLKVETGGLDSDGLPTKTRWRWPPNLSEQLGSGTIASTSKFITESQSISMEDSCDALRRIASNAQNVQAHIYSTAVKISVDSTIVASDSFVKQKQFEDILRGESAIGSKQAIARGSSGGIGINLGGLAIGGTGSKQATEVQDTRRRVVTGNLIQEAAADFAKTLTVQQRREIAPPSGTDPEIVALLTKFVTENSQSADASFAKTTADQWQLKLGSVTRSLTSADVDELLKSSGNPNLTVNHKQEGKAGAKGVSAEVRDEKNMTFQDQRGIEWSRKGEEWIPTSVKLYFLSESDLKSSIIAKYENALVQRGDVQRITLTQITADKSPDTVNWLLTGPDKKVIAIKGGLYRTDTYWAGAWRGGPYWCQPELKPMDGMTVVGAQHLETVGPGAPLSQIGRVLGCRPAGHCDSHGEACRSYYRSAGCYVSTKWLEWYRERIQDIGIKERIEDICSERKEKQK